MCWMLQYVNHAWKTEIDAHSVNEKKPFLCTPVMSFLPWQVCSYHAWGYPCHVMSFLIHCISLQCLGFKTLSYTNKAGWRAQLNWALHPTAHQQEERMLSMPHALHLKTLIYSSVVLSILDAMNLRISLSKFHVLSNIIWWSDVG